MPVVQILRKQYTRKATGYKELEDWLQERDLLTDTTDIENPIIRQVLFNKELYKLIKMPCRAGTVNIIELRNLFRIDPMITKVMFEMDIIRNLNEQKKTSAIYKWAAGEPNLAMAEMLYKEAMTRRDQREEDKAVEATEEAVMVVERNEPQGITNEALAELIEKFMAMIPERAEQKPVVVPTAAEIAELLKPFLVEQIKKNLDAHKQELNATMLQLISQLPHPEVQIVDREIHHHHEPVKKKGLFNSF